MIRVIVFDDNHARRSGLSLLLNAMEGLMCVDTFSDCRKAVEKVIETQPDVILMDIDMPFVNGIEGLKLLRPSFPDVKIVMQTVFEDEDKILEAICAGADGYLLKEKSPMKLIEGILEVVKGGAPMTPTVARKVLTLFRGRKEPVIAPEFKLTKRELEILSLLVEGLSYKMIADHCSIAYPTVNTHISHIYEKLQVNSVAAAVSKALREKLV